MPLDRKTLRDLKIRYGEIYSITIKDTEFFYRTISRKELYLTRDLFKDPNEFEEEVCRLAVAHPEGYNFLECFAGIPATICKEVLEKSGFLTDSKFAEEKFNEWREKIMEQEHRLDIMITTAFPHIEIDQIQSWTHDKYASMLARAEFVLLNIMGMPPELVQRLMMPKEDLEKVLEKESKKSAQGPSPEDFQRAQDYMDKGRR